MKKLSKGKLASVLALCAFTCGIPILSAPKQPLTAESPAKSGCSLLRASLPQSLLQSQALLNCLPLPGTQALGNAPSGAKTDAQALGNAPSGAKTGSQAGIPAEDGFLVKRQADFQSQLHHAELQEAIDSISEKYGATGVQAAVIEQGIVADTFAYGWATKETDPMTAGHKMRVASISKVVLGMAAMCLQEEGVVGLDEDISRYWGCNVENPAYPDIPITIRSLLSHTSSLEDSSENASLSYYSVQNSLTGSGYSQAVPGDIGSWYYNNYGFDILGITLELASGRMVDDVLKDHLYGKLGIDAAYEAGDIQDTGRLVTLYRDGQVTRSIEDQLLRHCSQQPCEKGVHFCGGLTISAYDLAKLVSVLAEDGAYYQEASGHADGTAVEHMDGNASHPANTYQKIQVLSPDSVEQMERIYNQPTPEGHYQAFPLRYRHNLYGRNRMFYHTGNAYGVLNCISYDPETGDGVVVLTTGAWESTDKNGIFGICSEINEIAYPILSGNT